MSNSKQGVAILSYTFSLVVILLISFSLFACDNLQSIPFSQVVADAKAGKVSQIRFYSDSDKLKVCYDKDCKVAKASTKPSGNNTLHDDLASTGVSPEQMPNISVYAPGPFGSSDLP